MIKPQNILVFLLVTSSFYSLAQKNTNDTLFLSKDSLVGVEQSIFITGNPDSKFYDQLSAFVFRTFDKNSYNESLEYLRENKQVLGKSAVALPFSKWVVLYQYKNKFYAYYPCDFLFHYRASVNDSCFIDWTGEGPVANKIISSKKIDNHTYELNMTGVYDKERKLTIHIIDEKKGIAIFETTVSGREKTYYLMIAADKIKSVPIIINNCESEKQREFQFEMPDYTELLERK